MQHESVRGLGRDDRAELLDGPVRGRMLGHIPVDDAPLFRGIGFNVLCHGSVWADDWRNVKR